MPQIATQQTNELDTVAATTTADELDALTNRIDILRRNLSEIVRHLPNNQLHAVWGLADAVQHLQKAAVAIDKTADRLDPNQAQATAGSADDAWADPDWQVDSATRTCCGGIGDHTQECATQPVGYTLTDAAIAAI